MPSFPVTQKKIAQETNDHEQGNQHEVAEAPRADEHGGRTIRQQTGYRRNTIIRAQFTNFFITPLSILLSYLANSLFVPAGRVEEFMLVCMLLGVCLVCYLLLYRPT